MILGYARVSKGEQNLDYQIKSLINAGVEERDIYFEKESGATFEKLIQLKKLLKYIKVGDTLIIEALDRLGRDPCEGYRILKFFSENKIILHIISSNIITDDPYNCDLLHVGVLLANWERKNIIRRTTKGLAAIAKSTKKRGPKSLLTDFQKEIIDNLHSKGETVINIRKKLGLKTNTCVYKYLNQRKKEELKQIYE